MIGDVFHIKINTSEENMDKGLYTLMTSGTVIICVGEDEYLIKPEAVDKLNEKKVIYELVTQRKEATIKKDSEDATEA